MGMSQYFSTGEKKKISFASEIENELFEQLVTSKVAPIPTRSDSAFPHQESAAPHVGQSNMWVPRKLRGGIQCFRDHGVVYTLRRALYHVGLWKDEEID